MSETAAPPPTHPRELTAFLTELAVAVHTHGVYPAGHPLRARTADALRARADALLAERGSVSLGVARRRLVVEGLATPEEHPLLSGLAERLHRMRVGAVTLQRGVEPAEVDALLAALSAEPERGGVVRPEEWPEGPHLRLHPMRFGELHMAEDDGDGPADAEGASRAAQLWLGLAQAATAGDGGEAWAAGAEAADAGEVARAIDGHPAAEAYDQVVVGYLLQLAEELKADAAGGAGTAQVRARASRVVAGLSEGTLRRLLRMGGDPAQRRRFVVDASRAFASDAVVRVVEAAAAASGQTVSHSLLRMLQKMASYADPGARVSPDADAALGEQVRALVDGWSLADPNPDAYTAVLQGFADAPARAPVHNGAWEMEPDRVLKTALETDADGDAARAAVARMLADGRAAEVVEMLAAAPPASTFAQAAWSAVASDEGLRALLRARQPDGAALDRVVARMGTAAIAPLLKAMADSPSRMVRRMAFDRLAALGPAAGEAAGALVDDPRWFVVRNALALLAETGAPAGFSPAAAARHADARVRREAYRVAFRTPGERTRGLCLALADDDGAAVRAALAEALGGCPAEAVPLVCRHAAAGAADAEARVLALRVLGTAQDATALRTLLAAADGGRDWRGRPRLAPRSAELLAALGALSAGWAAHAAAAPVLERARGAADPQVRAAAGGAP